MFITSEIFDRIRLAYFGIGTIFIGYAFLESIRLFIVSEHVTFLVLLETLGVLCIYVGMHLAILSVLYLDQTIQIVLNIIVRTFSFIRDLF